MKQTILVNGIKCYAYHGCLEEEARIGGNYVIDVELTTNFSVAAETDNLNETIDYCDVARIVQEEMAIRSKLIEHVGKRIHDRMWSELKGLKAIKLMVTKISPPIQGSVASVSVVFEN